MGNVSDLVHAGEMLKEIPAKTDEMLEHLRNIESILERVAESIEKLASE